MDLEKQVEYWTSGSAEDLAAAECLLEKGHVRHCLFCAHLAMDKTLKALVVQRTREVPLRIHNLTRLAGACGSGTATTGGPSSTSRDGRAW